MKRPQARIPDRSPDEAASPGASRLRVLHLERDAAFSARLAALLAEAGVAADVERIEDVERLEQALRTGDVGLVLSDDTDAGGDALEALRLARAARPGLPWVVVSAREGGERVVEALKRGASDYVVKARLERLVPVVRRALDEAPCDDRRRQTDVAFGHEAQDLRLALERLSIAQRAARVGVFEWDLATDEVYWTPELEQVLGCRLPAGRRYDAWLQLVHPADRARLQALFAEWLRSPRDEERWEYRFSRAGEERWIEASARLLRDPAGRPVRMIGTNLDITERVRARDELVQNELRLRALFENVALGVAEVDVDGRVENVNRRFCELLGYSREQLLGRSIHELTASEDRGRSRELNGRLLRGELEAFEYEKQYLRREGAPVWVHVTVSAVRDAAGRVLRAVGTIEDITERKLAEEALRRSEREYRTLAENAPEVIARFDRAQRHTYVNEYGARVYGWSREQVIGRTNAELGMPPEMVAFWRRHFEQVLASGEQRTVDFEFDSPTYGRRHFSALFVPERDDGREVSSVLAITRDVTSLRRTEEALRRSQAWLEAERARLQAIVDTIPVGLFIAGPAGEASLVNDEARRIWAGTSRLDRVAEYADFRAFRPGSDVPIRAEEWPAAQALLHGRTVKDLILDIERFDGTRGTIVASGAPIRDEAGRVVGSVAVNQDITDLRTMQARLEEADRRKDEFLAVLSHELRNPLAPIKTSLYILERAVPGGQQARHAHEVIARQVVHMTRLIDDLLDVTRISRGKVQLQRERLELCGLVARTLEDHRSLFKGAGIRLESRGCDGTIHVLGDPTRLAQVVGNLLSNAAKFTPPGGRVELWVEASAGEALVRVRDDGPGIAPALLPKLFEPFVQDDTTLDRSKGGLGLGLALVKGLTELHGGTASARSEGPGKGSEFTVRLPLFTPSGAASGVAPEREPTPGRARVPLRVLLIEDNQDAAQTLKEALELNGHAVETAASGLEGLERARQGRPDVVVCDIGLPGIDGFEVARRMRADPELRGACLVALSGYAAPDDLERSRAAGFAQHLAKPPNIDELESALVELCGRRDSGEGSADDASRP